jgi:ankyrin repeat protein
MSPFRSHRYVQEALCPGSEQLDEDVKKKLARWAIVRSQDDYGNTPLHLAAWNGSKKSFVWLLEQGADKVSQTPGNFQQAAKEN